MFYVLMMKTKGGTSMATDMEMFTRFPVACILVNTVGAPNFICNLRFMNLVGYTEPELTELMRKDFFSIFDELISICLYKLIRT